MEEKINKENLRLVMRFLKTANLWLTWLEYVDSVDYILPYKRMGYHWTEWNEVGEVFGHCSFTNFLRRRGIVLRSGRPNVAETFRAYIRLVKSSNFETAFHYAKTAFIKNENHLY